MIYSARQRHIPIVEATHDVLAVHQNHDYSHLSGGLKDCFVGPEGQRNQELYGLEQLLGILDSTHLLKNGRVRRALGGLTSHGISIPCPYFTPRWVL